MDKDAGGINIQDQYLGRARKDRSWLTLVLNSGKKISGRIVSFDRYTVLLEDRGSEQMVFKHAIATVSVSRSFSNTIDLNRPLPSKERPPGATGPRPPGREERDREERGGDAPDVESRVGDTPADPDRSRSGPPTAG